MSIFDFSKATSDTSDHGRHVDLAVDFDPECDVVIQAKRFTVPGQPLNRTGIRKK